MSEYDETKQSLHSLTAVNLKNEFKNVHDFCESAIHFANRCDMNLSLKQVVFAELSASHLRLQAQQRYLNGQITKDELADILDKSTDLIASLLPEEVTKAMIVACDCRKA